MSISWLANNVKTKQSFFAADFSSEVSRIKDDVKQSVGISENTLIDFGHRIFAAISESSVAVKLNFSDFLMLPGSMKMLTEIIRAAKSCGLYVILKADGVCGELLPVLFGKRIKEYVFEPDALEICMYCADEDMILKLSKIYSKDIFITLNTEDIHLPVLYAEHVKKYMDSENTGLSILKNDSDRLCEIREILHDYMFLAQGGEIDESIKNCFNSDGSGAIVSMPASRFIHSIQNFEHEAALGTMKSAAAINRRLFKKSRLIKL